MYNETQKIPTNFVQCSSNIYNGVLAALDKSHFNVQEDIGHNPRSPSGNGCQCNSGNQTSSSNQVRHRLMER